MGAGRILCVALPYALTVVSLISILTVSLAGITSKGLDLFEINTAKFSASSNSLANLAHEIFDRDLKVPNYLSQPTGRNISAKDLGLAGSYKVFLWNYCSITGTNQTCPAPQFNWAAHTLNASRIEARVSSAAGAPVELPDEMTKAFKSFIAISKWTQVAFIIAAITNAVMLIFGVLAFCSRAGSCLTLLVSGLATTSIIIASTLATIQAAAVTAALNSTTEAFNVKSHINTSFLATSWLAVALSSTAGLVWALTGCCCATNRSSGPSPRGAVTEKSEKSRNIGLYQRMNEPNYYGANYDNGDPGPSPYNPQQYNIPLQKRPSKRGNAYEPYAHAAI